MKKTILFYALLAFLNAGFAQKNYTVKGETLELKTEIEG